MKKWNYLSTIYNTKCKGEAQFVFCFCCCIFPVEELTRTLGLEFLRTEFLGLDCPVESEEPLNGAVMPVIEWPCWVLSTVIGTSGLPQVGFLQQEGELSHPLLVDSSETSSGILLQDGVRKGKILNWVENKGQHKLERGSRMPFQFKKGLLHTTGLLPTTRRIPHLKEQCSMSFNKCKQLYSV